MIHLKIILVRVVLTFNASAIAVNPSSTVLFAIGKRSEMINKKNWEIKFSHSAIAGYQLATSFHFFFFLLNDNEFW